MTPPEELANIAADGFHGNALSHDTALWKETRDIWLAGYRAAQGALDADARRYRWLREGRMEFGPQPSSDPDLYIDAYWWLDSAEMTPEQVDSVIDAAKEPPQATEGEGK